MWVTDLHDAEKDSTHLLVFWEKMKLVLWGKTLFSPDDRLTDQPADGRLPYLQIQIHTVAICGRSATSIFEGNIRACKIWLFPMPYKAVFQA